MRYFIFIIFSLYSTLGIAQNGFYGKQSTIRKICNNHSAHAFGESILEIPKHKNKFENGFTSEIIKRIVFTIDNPINFVLEECSSVSNCVAGKDEYLLYLFYNSSFIASLDAVSNKHTFIEPLTSEKKWKQIAVLAHEVGHLILEHWSNSNQSTPPLELEADQYAGMVLARLGATLKESQKIMNTSHVSEKRSFSHPSRSERLNAIKKGWESVKNRNDWIWFQKGLDKYFSKDFDSAMSFLTKAKNIPIANYIMGEIVWSGKAKGKYGSDYKPYYQIAAEANIANAILMLAHGSFKKIMPNDYLSDIPTKTGFDLYKKAANLGSREGMFMVGKYYEAGYYVTKNTSTALNWYLKAAQAGYPDALIRVGMIYNGYDINGHENVNFHTNKTKAFEWYLKAYQNGKTEALFYSGMLYQYGEGVNKSLERGINLYEQFFREMDQTNEGISQFVGDGAACNLARSYYDSKQYKKVYKWAERATRDFNSSLGYYYLAACYVSGFGVKENRELGMKYLKKSAWMGCRIAQEECQAAGIKYK